VLPAPGHVEILNEYYQAPSEELASRHFVLSSLRRIGHRIGEDLVIKQGGLSADRGRLPAMDRSESKRLS